MQPSPSPPNPSALREHDSGSTNVRAGILLLLVSMAVLLYLDRYCLGAVSPIMIRELGVTKEEFGRAVGAFFLVYALLQVPAGQLCDYLGTRITLAVFVLGWSLATASLGWVQSLTAIATVRMILGAMQAGAYPAAAAGVKRWMSQSSRARANSAVSMGGRLGSLLAFLLTPLLVKFVAMHFGITVGAWRPVFIAYGALGVVWSVLFLWWFRESPRVHPRCSAAEVAFIEGPDAPLIDLAPSLNERFRSTSRLITGAAQSRSFWLLCAINALVNVGWIFLVTWMPVYLRENFHTGETVSGMIPAITAAAGMLGNLAGGFVGDLLARRYGLRWGRRIPGIISGLSAASVYLVAMVAPRDWQFVTLMALVSFLSDFALGAQWATYQDIGGRNTASVLGFTNMCGNLAAAGFGWYIGRLADLHLWPVVLLISSLSFILTAVCWLGIDATRPLAMGDES